MREPFISVKAGRSLSAEPRLEVLTAKADVLALSHRRQLAAPDRLINIPAREAQLGGGVGHSEELVARGAGSLSLDWFCGADHSDPEGRPDLLERSEQGRNLVEAEFSHALRIGDQQGELRKSVRVHRPPWGERGERALAVPALTSAGQAKQCLWNRTARSPAPPTA